MTEPTAPRPCHRLRRRAVPQYMREYHGIEMTEKTLRNRNAAGLDPKPEYLGTIPYYRPEVLDAFAESAFTAESPVTVTRRRRQQAEVAGQEDDEDEPDAAA